jgi:hypothetical protein
MLKIFDAYPEIFLDQGSMREKFGSGIRDKHPGSATLAMVPVSDNVIILLDNIINVKVFRQHYCAKEKMGTLCL